MEQKRPEIANSIQTGAFKTNYHDLGKGFPVVFLHGSGPGVTAWANWNKVFPLMQDDFRLIAPDMVGFGYTERVEGQVYNMNVWVQQTIDLFDALGIEKANLVGNSFGGALALSMAVQYPERVNKLVCMGAMGVSFPITYGLIIPLPHQSWQNPAIREVYSPVSRKVFPRCSRFPGRTAWRIWQAISSISVTSLMRHLSSMAGRTG